MRPVALVTGEVSPYRREPFRLLAEAEGMEVIAFRESRGEPTRGFTVRRTSQLEAARLVGSGRYRAVIASLGGRIALPATYVAARRARIPFVLWAALRAHPRTPAHALSWLPTRYLYRRADAVVTYGRHVTSYVERSRGARGNLFEAPQAVSAAHFGAPVSPEQRKAARVRAGARDTDFLLLFVGRLERDKGIHTLIDAWRRAALPEGATLALAGAGPLRPNAPGTRLLGPVDRQRLPALYAAADALVLPSVRTATSLETWGLVVNEAMHQGTPVIASDAVGAVPGGLVREGRNGLVVPAGDAESLATRIRALAMNPALRERMGQAARRDVEQFSEVAWVEGMQQALRAVGAGRARE
jgi:glycosyltransferase involved in cell wall biosynthesis